MRFKLASAVLLGATLYAAAAGAVTIPRPAGDVVIQLPFGQEKLSNYKGKVVVLGFIVSTWPHCQLTTQVLSGIQNDYKSKGVQVLEAAFDEEANMPDFIAKVHPTFPVGKVSREFIANYSQITPMMRVNVPILFFIDRKGIIQAQYFGNDQFFMPESEMNNRIRAEIDKLLGPQQNPERKRGAKKK